MTGASHDSHHGGTADAFTVRGRGKKLAQRLNREGGRRGGCLGVETRGKMTNGFESQLVFCV